MNAFIYVLFSECFLLLFAQHVRKGKASCYCFINYFNTCILMQSKLSNLIKKKSELFKIVSKIIKSIISILSGFGTSTSFCI